MADIVTLVGVLPSLYDGLTQPAGGGVQLNSLSDLIKVVANVARILIALAGGLAVLFIVVSGVFYVVSAGDAGRVKQAKSILVNAVVGLVVISVSYAVLTLISSRF